MILYIVLSPSPKRNESLVCDRVQSLKNYIHMRFLKGDFKDLPVDEISVETDVKVKEEASSDYYPSAEVHGLKSLSTTTTANRVEKDTSWKFQHLGAFRMHINNTKEYSEINEESGSEQEEPVGNAVLSPPLARQLFSKHDLFDTEVVHSPDNDNRDAPIPNSKWFTEEDLSPKSVETIKTSTQDKQSSNKENINMNIDYSTNKSIDPAIKSETTKKPSSSVKIRIKLNKEDLPNEYFTVNKDLEVSIELSGDAKLATENASSIDKISSKLLEGIKEHLRQSLYQAESLKVETEPSPKVKNPEKSGKRNKPKSMQFLLETRPLKRSKLNCKSKVELLNSK